jgi:hypothetical protein
VDTLILVKGTAIETLNTGDKGGEVFEHTRDSVILFRDYGAFFIVGMLASLIIINHISMRKVPLFTV